MPEPIKAQSSFLGRFMDELLPEMIKNSQVDPDQVREALGVIGLMSQAFHPGKGMHEIYAENAVKMLKIFGASHGVSFNEMRTLSPKMKSDFQKFLAKKFETNPALVCFAREMKTLGESMASGR